MRFLRQRVRRLAWAPASALVAMQTLLSGCALLTVGSKETTTAERLNELPTTKLPLAKGVTLRFTANQVPYIEAQTDDDLAFTIGLVHAHHRLGQIEICRHIS